MKLKDYIKHLKKIDEKHPDLEVVYAVCDDFRTVGHPPFLGNYYGNYRGDFIADDGTEEFKKNYEINAVCLN